MAKRAAIYTRVSSVEQGTDQHASLPVQEIRCRAYVEQQGWSLVSMETDRESGLHPQRPGYRRILELARAKSIDVVVVMAASRWGRDAAEVLTRSKELTDLGVQLVSTQEDLTSFLMLGIQAVLNEEESRRISARVGPAKRLKASQGYWMSPTPFGTRNDKGILRPNEKFPILQQIFRLTIEGMPAREITRRINAQLAPAHIDSSTTRKVITNPAYIGKVRWKDEVFPALWEPLIPVETFEAAGVALRGRYRQRMHLTSSRPYWIVGLAHCVCGARMHPKIERKSWGKIYPYLICGRLNSRTMMRGCGSFGSIQLLDVQDWVVDQLLDLQQSGIDEHLARMTAAAHRIQAATEAQRTALAGEKRRLDARVERVEQGYLDGLWGADRVLSLKAALKDQLAALDRDLWQLPNHAPTRDVDIVRDALKNVDWIAGRDAAPEAFREVLKVLIARVVVSGPGEYALELVGATVDV